MSATEMTLRDILDAAARGIASYLGPQWKLCHTEQLVAAAITRIHVYDDTGAEADLWAFVPLEISHPAAIIAAIVMAHRLRHSTAAQDAVTETFGDDDEDDAALQPIQEARRFDA